MRRFNREFNVATALLCLAGVVGATESSLLPIEPGVYVVSRFKPCKDAPLAAVLRFDGKAFSGPHTSACSSSVLERQNTTYQVATECRALGDGSSAKPDTLVDYFRVVSPTHFMRIGQGIDSDYELCPTFR